MKTFKDLRIFNRVSQGYVQRMQNASTKLVYAIKRIGERAVTPIMKDYNLAYGDEYYTKVETVQIDNALTNKETGALIAAPQGSDRPYTYDKEGIKRVIEAERNFADVLAPALLEAWDKKEYEIEPFMVTDIPEDLTVEEIEAFRGFCIPEDYKVEQEEAK